MKSFSRVGSLPTYVFGLVDQLKSVYLQHGVDIFDFSMGNPDGATPTPIVDALIQAIESPLTHRYAKSRGIYSFRKTISQWYESNYGVLVDPDNEVVATIGAKEGISHLVLAMTNADDCALVPAPSYPIHTYSFLIAGAQVETFTVQSEEKMLVEIKQKLAGNNNITTIMLNFPANPTGHCVDLAFFEEIITIAKHHKIWVIHDFAYADICFDGIKAPSILQVKGSKDIAVEICSLSKSYNMPGWRVGYVAGNPVMVGALIKIKSYYDYGIFEPIQIASIMAMTQCDAQRKIICEIYQQRRDCLCDGLQRIGWPVTKPKATMFVWAKIPPPFNHMDSLSFTKLLLEETQTVVSPGIGFGPSGDDSVRFALVEDTQRIEKAIEKLGSFFNQHRR